MMLNLPLELLNLIFDYLEDQHDFRSLLACALTTKLLARIALHRLYRIHSYSKVLCSDDFYNQGFGVPREGSRDLRISPQLRRRYVLRRERLWKSIILSSIGKTAYPYCLYIQSLHLNNLFALLKKGYLLKETKLSEELFVGDMASFFPRLKKIKVPDDPFESALFYSFDRPAAIQRIGDSIMSRVSEATKQPRPTANIQRLLVSDQRVRIKSWVSQLPKLKTLETGDATSLTPDLAKLIAENCPDFCNLTVSSIAKARQDAELGLFLYELKQNTLQRLIVSAHFVAGETLLSLNNHAESLSSLKIFGLLSVGAKKLGLLRPCKALVTVELSFSVPGSIPTMPGLVRIKNDQQDAIIDWLCGCRNLRELAVENLSKGSTVLSQVCSKSWIRLRKLKLLGFRFDKSLDFFRALSSQADLYHLFLGGDPECCRPSHCDIFMGCLASLNNLKYLRLTPDFISGSYSMYRTMDIISYIPGVEELTIACRSADDIFWLVLLTLRYLRVLRIYGLVEFTLNGILEYIKNLQATNHGLSLLIIGQSRARPITMAQQEFISRTLHAKVGACFQVETL